MRKTNLDKQTEHDKMGLGANTVKAERGQLNISKVQCIELVVMTLLLCKFGLV